MTGQPLIYKIKHIREGQRPDKPPAIWSRRRKYAAAYPARKGRGAQIKGVSAFFVHLDIEKKASYIMQI